MVDISTPPLEIRQDFPIRGPNYPSRSRHVLQKGAKAPPLIHGHPSSEWAAFPVAESHRETPGGGRPLVCKATLLQTLHHLYDVLEQLSDHEDDGRNDLDDKLSHTWSSKLGTSKPQSFCIIFLP